jgi:S-DNA-T family DNA segregation ATPase FtsK/SpoIIIE
MAFFIRVNVMTGIIEEKTVRGLREVALLGFVTMALFFFIALITFSNEDAGWTHSGSMQSISNACGVVGAWVSDFVLSIFGLMAYLFPVMLLWHGYLIYTHEQWQRGKLILAIRWFGFVATIISGCAIFYLHILRLQVDLPGSTGGILGQEIGGTLLIILGNSGATLLFLAIFLAGITLFTGLSWIALLDVVGRYTLMAGHRVYQQSLSIYDAYRDYRIQSKLRVRKELTVNKKAAKGSKVNVSPALAQPVLQIELSDREYKESQADLFEPDILEAGAQGTSLYQGKLPTLALLDKRRVITQGYSQTELEEISRQLEDVLLDFNVVVQVVAVFPGPVITRFELQLAAGIKVSRVSGLSKDIARGLSVTSVRIVDVIQGKSVIGLEIPNQEREMVSFRDLIASKNFENSKSKLTFAMGKDIAGMPVVADLGKMPHVLVAGTTGSGKSVAINTMILSLLYKSTPEEVRLIMIDPKMLELSVYEGIPHLLTPVVTDMKDAQNALRWAVAEMERRY